MLVLYVTRSLHVETEQHSLIRMVLLSLTRLHLCYAYTTRETSHIPSGWLKTGASLNIHFIFATLATFHDSSGWLNALPECGLFVFWWPSNMDSMSVTLLTSHFANAWLNLCPLILSPKNTGISNIDVSVRQRMGLFSSRWHAFGIGHFDEEVLVCANYKVNKKR